ncbi:putative DNA replication factor [Trypoxylus dichotomus]
MAKKSRHARVKKVKELPNQANLQTLLNNVAVKESTRREVSDVTPRNEVQKEPVHVTPPSTPTKRVNAMDKVKPIARELSFNELKQKLSRSSRLAELKASITKFKQLDSKLEAVEKKTSKIEDSPNLKNFRTIELEVALSPTKTLSPEKVYLSPKKDTTVKKNLLNLLSPTKNAVALPSAPAKLQVLEFVKPSLTLPFKYRCLLEFFRNIDTVVQIMFNRKETITFRKLKPAVEELLKRNLYERHLSQIKSIYPEAFNFKQEKLKAFGAGVRQGQWELVVEPKIDQETMSADILLQRRKKFHDILLEKTVAYHSEFLLTLEPPLNIPMNKLKRWHPEFNLETLPDIEEISLPQAPHEEKFSTGKEVLEKARSLFNCNTRMEEALARLKQTKTSHAATSTDTALKPASLLKGIPKCLLEKVRQKQAAKALESMTRSTVKEKEVQLYGRLPEIARLTRNLFVAERKNVLNLDTVLDKLGNSFCTYLTKDEMETHLRTISKEIPGWLDFHNIRGNTYLKISKNSDLSLVLSKLNVLAKDKVS